MSWKGSAWAKETMGHGSYAQKLILMMLGEYHNTELNIAYPSIKELARVCEMPERTVRWCLKNLEDMGYIVTKQKGNQYQRTEYLLNFATTHTCEAAKDGAAIVASAGAAAKDGEVQRQRDASEAAIPVHTNLQEPSLEPLLEREVAKKKALPITSDFIEELVAEFSPQLGGGVRCREIVEEAMNHKAVDKRKDKRLYLRGWLRREVGYLRSGTYTNGIGRDPRGQLPKDFKEYAEVKDAASW